MHRIWCIVVAVAVAAVAVAVAAAAAAAAAATAVVAAGQDCFFKWLVLCRVCSFMPEYNVEQFK